MGYLSYAVLTLLIGAAVAFPNQVIANCHTQEQRDFYFNILIFSKHQSLKGNFPIPLLILTNLPMPFLRLKNLTVAMKFNIICYQIVFIFVQQKV